MCIRDRTASATDSVQLDDNSSTNTNAIEESSEESEDDISALLEDDNLLADLETDSLATDSAEELSFEEFAQNNPLYAVLYPNVNQQNQIQPGPVVGFCAVKDTSTLNNYLNDPAAVSYTHLTLPTNREV